MFGLFSPRCPVDTWQKAWTETRMCWLADRFGIDRLLRADVILPTPDHFPEPYQGTDEYARLLLDRLCGYMNIAQNTVTLTVCADTELPGAAGQYERGNTALIRVGASQLADPQRLLA